MKWTQGAQWDGSSGVGQQMSALSAVGANMIRVGGLKAPFTRDTGGESVGDPNAGTDADVPAGGEGGENHVLTDPITMGDKAGAGILTALVLSFTLGGGWFLLAG
jgi:mannan endo-1,6-alpha-mannosidase